MLSQGGRFRRGALPQGEKFTFYKYAGCGHDASPVILIIKTTDFFEPSAFAADSDDSAAQALFRSVLAAPHSSKISVVFI